MHIKNRIVNQKNLFFKFIGFNIFNGLSNGNYEEYSIILNPEDHLPLSVNDSIMFEILNGSPSEQENNNGVSVTDEGIIIVNAQMAQADNITDIDIVLKNAVDWIDGNVNLSVY